MMRARDVIAVALVAAYATAAVLACNLLSGAGDLTTSDEVPGDETRPRDGDDGGASLPDAAVPPPTCACVAPPAAGWTGPFALLEASGVARACPAGLTAKVSAGVAPSGVSSSKNAACTPCSCGDARDACSSVHLETSFAPSCGDPCNSLRTIDGGCGPMKYCSPTGSAIVTSALDAGSCSPDGGKPAPAAWTKSAVACDFTVPSGTTCAAGQVCAPKSEGAPDARTCIVHAGDMACPPGPYATRVVYDTELVDTRACSVCTCDPPQGSCTAGTLTLYSDNACADNAKTVPTTGTCTTVTASDGSGSAKLTAIPMVIDAGCTPRGGALLDGGVTGASPSTVCCL